MLGIGDYHEYGECCTCGSIQNLNPPNNLSKYYPSNYYSFKKKIEHPLKRWVRTQRALYNLGKVNFIGGTSTIFFGKPYFVDWLKRAGVTRDSAILDVGCGSGALLFHLKDCGYRNLSGVDPFLNEAIHQTGLHLLKLDVSDVTTKFDFIMMHHSLEHVLNPMRTLQHVTRLLNPNGICLVRVPVAGTWAWETYGSDWVQLDAPRHLLIPSIAGMQYLTQKIGLAIEEIQFDSDRFQFVGSEKIKQGLDSSGDTQTSFSRRQLREFDRHAEQLNADKNGDQACFWLRNINNLKIGFQPNGSSTQSC